MRLMLPLCAALLGIPAMAQSEAEQQAAEKLQQSMGAGGMGDIKIVDDNDPFEPNTFIGSFRMEIHSFKKGKEEKESPMSMTLWSSPDKTLFSFNSAKTQGADVKMLNDLKGKWSYILMATSNGNKTAIKSHKKKVTYTGDEKVQEKDMSFTVTDETKTIDGHLCKKVIARNDEGTWTAWIAQDIPTPFTDLLNSMRQPGQPDRFKAWDGLNGFPMEMNSESTNGKEKTTMYTKDLKVGAVDASVFSLDGYQVMEMPSMGR